ncbi:MAG: hypothetical protein IJ242_12130 [Clostridia bacterium]|nr:hypothetical protein [Clostridia bacterium]
MKYTLDTIPVLDAFKQDCQCPMCRLQILCEDGYIDGLLSSAYMEPECRVRTNKTGFCSRHYAQMYERRNRLGLALMTHTHLQELIRSLEETMGTPAKKNSRLPFFTASVQEDGRPAKIRAGIDACDICDQLDKTMRRYAFTVIRLVLDKPEFKSRFEKTGACLPHTALLLDLSEETLSGRERETFESFLKDVTLHRLHEIESNLYDFTQQFDYRNAGVAPTQAARDSVEHALNRLAGAIIGDEAARPAHND